VAIALEMDAAGYTKEEAVEIYNFTKDIDQLRNAIMRRCGDYVDLGKYDAEMRALLDDYVVSPQSQVLASLDDFSFLDVIEIKEGEDDDIVILSDPPIEEVLGGQRGVAETMTQNVRRVINRKRDTNPEEYKKFSEKINRLLEEFQQKQIEYKEFLKSIVELANQLKKDTRPDERLNTSLKKSLYDNLGKNVEFALAIYNVIESKAEIGFRENMMRRKKLKREIENALAGTDYDAEEILQIVIAHTDFQR
jgi:type I restriction enzyme R subunit